MRMLTSSIVFVLIAVSTTPGQSGRNMFIYKSGGQLDSMLLTKADSALFVNDTMLLYCTGNTLFRHAMSDIDSITFPYIGGPAITLLEPDPGTVYHVGDSLIVRWKINPLIVTAGVYFQLTVNDGESFFTIVPTTQHYPGPLYDGIQGRYAWHIQDHVYDVSLGDMALVSQQCRIRVTEYNTEGTPDRTVTSDLFTIAQ